MNKTIVTKSGAETQKLGEDFAPHVKNGGIILLYGDLGSGKTTFTQGLAKGLGLTNRIISPTFVIIRTYEIQGKNQNSKFESKGINSKVFYHIDLYRIETEHDLEGLGIKEILKDPNNIVVIEWPEKLYRNIPNKRFEIKFSVLDNNLHKIESEKYE